MAKTITVPVPTVGFKTQNTLLWVIAIVIVVIILAIAYRIYQATVSAAGAAGTLLDNTVRSEATGISVARLNVIKTIAEDAHKAIWKEKAGWWDIFGQMNGGWTAMTEDEQSFVNAVNRLVTIEEVSVFNDEYRTIGGHSAKADMTEYLSPTNVSSIKTLIRTNLN